MTTKSAGITQSAAFHGAVILIATFMPWLRVHGNQNDGFNSRMTLLNVVIPNWVPLALSLVVLADRIARARGVELMADRVPIVLSLCGVLHVVMLLIITAESDAAATGIGALVTGILSMSLAIRLARHRAEGRRAEARDGSAFAGFPDVQR